MEKGSNSVPAAIRLELSLLYNQTEALPYAGVNTDSGEDTHSICGLQWEDLEAGEGFFFFLIEFQRGTKSFVRRYAFPLTSFNNIKKKSF